MARFGLKDIELLGYSNPKIIMNEISPHWTLYNATAVAGLEELQAHFLYLKGECTSQEAQNAARYLPPSGQRYVIKARSLELINKTLQLIFPRIKIYIHEDLVWDKVYKTFNQYIDSLAEVPSERYYIPPRSSDVTIGDNLHKNLIDYLKGTRREDEGRVLIVRANAGVGKTTLARSLVRELGRQVKITRTIPVFVEAQHWGKLQLDSLERLWEVIDNSLRTFAGDLRLREDLFEYALQQGFLCFIFDGFDELCGRRVSNFVPSDILHDLAKIAEKSAGRILITTRTMYWQAEVTSPPENLITIDVDAFNTQQAKGYFSKYFAQDHDAQGRAVSIYKNLIKGSFKPREEGGVRAQFVNLPLCVNLVAEYVRSGGTEVDAKNSRQLVEKLISDICQREVERKQLQTKSRDQIRAFQEISFYDTDHINPEFDLDILDAAGIESADIKKMVDHALLDMISGNKYRFKYDFLGPYLRALYVSSAIENSVKEFSSSAIELMRHEANGKGFMLEHLVMLLGPDNLKAAGEAYQSIRASDYDARSFLVHLTQALVASDPSIKTHADRTNVLFKLLDSNFADDRVIRQLSIVGILEDLDLSGVKFEDGRFNDVVFRRCNANKQTIFDKCIFGGELTFDCATGGKSGWIEAQVMKNCTLHFPASVVWDHLQGGGIVSWDEQVLDALRIGLGKFWFHGRPKNRIIVEDWNKGLLKHLNLSSPLLNAMLRVRLLNRSAKRTGNADWLEVDEDSRGDLQRFMDNQQLGGKIKEVYDLLCQEK